MERIEVTVNRREPNQRARAIRKGGLLPGIVYGAGGADVPVTVDLRTFERSGLSSAGSHLVHFSSPEPVLDGNMALIRELQVNPLTGRAIHVDFLRIDMSKPVDAFVPLSFVGKPAGAVEGGILQPLRRELEVRADADGDSEPALARDRNGRAERDDARQRLRLSSEAAQRAPAASEVRGAVRRCENDDLVAAAAQLLRGGVHVLVDRVRLRPRERRDHADP